jgi:hypothetical protein
MSPLGEGTGTLTLAAAGDDVDDARATLRSTLDTAAIGSLTASVAHAGNNRLTVILSCLDLMQAGNVDEEDLKRALELATGAVQQLAADFARLLATVRGPATQQGAVDLGQAVAGARRLDALLHDTALPVEIDVPAGLLVDLNRETLVAALLRVLLLARRCGARGVHASGGVIDVPARTMGPPALRKGRHCRLSMDLVDARLPAGLRTGPVEPGHVVERLDEPLGLQLAALEACVNSVRGQVVVREGRDADTTCVELYLPASGRNP